MSRDFDKAQEMVVASMEYVKVLGFRIRRTEVQRDDWKQVAQSHADEMIKLRQHVDALKAERDAAKQEAVSARQDAVTRAEADRKRIDGLMIQVQDMRAEIDSLKREERATHDTLKPLVERVVKERDALRTECDDLRGIFDMVHASLGIKCGDHIGKAIEALKQRSVTTPKRTHPVAVGEYLRRLTGFSTTPAGEVAQVLHVDSPTTEYTVKRPNGQQGVWLESGCEPCDPPVDHDTPAGKETAQAAAEPKPGDVVRLVREPTHTDIPAMLPWSNAFGMPGDTATVVIMAVPDKLPNGTIPVRTSKGQAFFWPLSCIEVVKGGKS